MILKIAMNAADRKFGWCFVGNIHEVTTAILEEGSTTMEVFWGHYRSFSYDDKEPAELKDNAPKFISAHCTFTDGTKDKTYAIATAAYLLSNDGKTIEKLYAS